VERRHAVRVIARACRIRTGRLLVHFPGSTGVGKTELCKALAEVLFDDETR